MKPSLFVILAVAVFAATAPVTKWKPNDRNRPLPAQVTPGERPGAAPSDAVQLFNGKDLSAWKQQSGKPLAWKVESGYFEVSPGTGNLETRESFGDCQLHVEWATPKNPHGVDQEPGNSGVYLHSLYEIQVLDSYRNKTYADGQAGAIYSEYPPQVNPSLPPGEWQTYDIVFHAPRFSGAKLEEYATVTLFFNGVLAQDHVSLTRPTGSPTQTPYQPAPGKFPLLLQDHGQPVRYRNIWIRELKDVN